MNRHTHHTLLIRPYFEYAVQMWPAVLKTDTGAMEKIQRRNQTSTSLSVWPSHHGTTQKREPLRNKNILSGHENLDGSQLFEARKNTLRGNCHNYTRNNVIKI